MINKVNLEKLRVDVFANQCESILKRKGWDLRKEYSELDNAINNIDYSHTLHCFQVALFKHEDLGDLTTEERIALVGECMIPDCDLLSSAS